MSSEDQSAAGNKAMDTDNDGMSWWYRWMCKIAGVLGGVCEYGVAVALSLFAMPYINCCILTYATKHFLFLLNQIIFMLNAQKTVH